MYGVGRGAGKYSVYSHVGGWIYGQIVKLSNCQVVKLSDFRVGRELFVLFAEFEAGVGHHLLDFLLAGLGADEEDTVGIGDDVVLKAVDHDEFVAADGEDVAGGVVGQHVAVLHHVCFGVLGGEVVEGAPCAEVVPSEGDGFDEYVCGSLHHGVVD